MLTTLIALAGLLIFGWGLYWVWIVATSPLDEGLRWYDVVAPVVGAVMIVGALGG